MSRHRGDAGSTGSQEDLLNHPRSSGSGPIAFDVRGKAEELPKHPPPTYSACLGFYYRFINPWIRFLIIVPLLYIYSIILSLATFRNLLFQMQVANMPRPTITHPLFNMERGMSPFILPDILFDVINASPFPSKEYSSWKAFIDATPGFWCVALLILFVQGNAIRFTEFVSIHLVLYVIQSALKAFTNYPAASGVDPSCYNTDHTEMGSWIVKNFSVDYCGDQMFSGHTSESLVAMIIFRRALWDYLGWGFARTKEQEVKNYEDIARQSHEIKLSHLRVDAAFRGSEDLFFHQCDVRTAPEWVQRHRGAVWWATTMLRFVMWFWFFLFMYALLHNRQHYSSDIFVAVIMMLLLTTNRTLLVFLTRWLYRPNFRNYKKEGFFSRLYLKEPLTLEQVSYERQISRIGRGGII